MTDPSSSPTRGFPGPAYPLGANPSFADLVRANEGIGDRLARPAVDGPPHGTLHATTVLAIRFNQGVAMAGDRRATEGYLIADERIEKVFPADETSAIAIAGAAGQATEIVRLFQTELEHYEKVEGERLSLEGKANRLAQMIRGNFPMALQGLVVVPLFAGYDQRRAEGRIFRYDVTGGRWEEADYHSTGSGSLHARSTLKKRWRPGMDEEAAVRASVEALYDASQEDLATGGPNVLRGIFPTIKTITARGVIPVPENDVRAAFESIVERDQEARREHGGSSAREEEQPAGEGQP